MTPFLQAVWYAWDNIVDFLMEHGADVTKTSMVASPVPPTAIITHVRLTCRVLQDGQGALHYAARKDLVTSTKKLLDAGLEPDVEDEVRAARSLQLPVHRLTCVPHVQHGGAPLLYAATAGNLNIMSLLLDRGADMNHQSKVPTYFLLLVSHAARV